LAVGGLDKKQIEKGNATGSTQKIWALT